MVGGATPDQYPSIGQPYSAYWIFSNYATTATVTAFMASDPYYQNNLVKFFRISNYTVPNVNTGAAYNLVNAGIDTAYNTQPTPTVSVATATKTFFALFYVYGPDIFTTRTPFRTAHLMNCNTYVNASLMVIGGAFPPTDAQPYGAMFVFNQNANATLISQFVANDPYVQNNLVVRCARRCRRACGLHADSVAVPHCQLLHPQLVCPSHLAVCGRGCHLRLLSAAAVATAQPAAGCVFGTRRHAAQPDPRRAGGRHDAGALEQAHGHTFSLFVVQPTVRCYATKTLRR